MKKTILLIVFALLCVLSVAYATTPPFVAGKPAIYDNWNTAVYEDGLVLFMRFDNESSVGENDTRVYDWTGLGNNGTVTGAVYNLTSKVLGESAMEFDGDADYIDLNQFTLDLTSTQGNTIIFWAKGNSSGINRYVFSNSSAFTHHFIIFRGNDGGIQLETDTNADACFSDPINNNPEDWHQYVLNVTNKICTFYRDGIKLTMADNTISDNITLNRISINSVTLAFNGSIDEVMIFNRSLSSSEILDIYNQQNENKVKVYENMNVISSVTLLNQVYNLTDPEVNGAIIINSNNITLDCNGATLQGNDSTGSIGIRSNGKDNVTIRNCIVSNYTKCSWVSNADTLLFSNVTISSCSIYPIQASFMDNLTITNSTFNDNGLYVFIEKSSENVNITNNLFNKTELRIQDGSHNPRVFNNNFFNCTTGNCISTNVNNSEISYNTLNITNGSGIIIWGDNNNIFNNNIYGFWEHPAIDYNNINGGIGATNNSVYNNLLIGNGTVQGIELDGTINSLVYNNIIFNTSYSIILVDATITNNNKIYNNTFNVSSIACVQGKGQNNFTDNIFIDCNLEVGWGDGNISHSTFFLNNIYLDGIVRYRLSDLGNNITINETSSNYHFINFTQPFFKSSIKFTYNGRKDFRVENNTITINNMPTSFNQWFNGTSTTATAENFNSATSGIGASASSFAFSYITASQPKFNSIPLAVTDLTYTYNSSAKKLTIVCTGTGGFAVTNLNSIKGDDGFYNIHHNGLKLTKSNTNTYTTSSCSTWIFSSSDTTVKSAMDDMIDQLRKIIPWLGIIIIVALASIVLFMVKGEVDPEQGMKTITALILAVIAIAIILSVSILLLTELGKV